MIEDNLAILRTNRTALKLEGYRVLEADTLAKGRKMTEQENPDLILLDILMPDGNGLEYCRDYLGKNGARILFLSALNTKEDVIAGLRAGGDDYIAKPYLMEELLARVEALLRRGRLIKMEEPPLRIGALELKFAPRQAYLNGNQLSLTPMEFTMLEYLSRHMGDYVTAEELYAKIWGMDTAGDVRTVWEHVSRIRNKLGKTAPVDIVSERGKGYRLAVMG